MIAELILTGLMIQNLNKISGEKAMLSNYEAEQCEFYGISQEEFRHSILTIDGDRAYITDDEIALLERVVMSEAGNQSVECQEAVATVILNRWQCKDKFADTIEGVVFAPNQFSTHDNGEPTVSVRVAVYNAIVYYNTACMNIPYQIYYFRSGHYHNFGTPYQCIDDLYFSGPADMVL